MIGSTIHDIDAGAAQGISITSASITTGSGVWEYSTDGGISWIGIGAVNCETL